MRGGQLPSGAGDELLYDSLEATGFIHGGQPAPGLLQAEALRSRPSLIDRRIRYDAAFDPTKLGARAVFEVAGSPCIYFTALDEHRPDAARLARLQRTAWNHGLAPVLWIATPHKVLLYDCFSRPDRSEQYDEEKHLIHAFDVTRAGLRDLKAAAGRLAVETGQLWQWGPARRIDRKHRVDSSLLRDLIHAERRLTDDYEVDRSIAQALISRSIFTAYLVHRGILPSSMLQVKFGVSELQDLFADKHSAYDVFEWVSATFDGDLFPLHQLGGRSERDVITPARFSVVQDLIAATDQRTGQISLWPYDFSVIPVELVSSIYEQFTHSDDPKLARQRSTHYTPLNLVDLTLSQVFEGLKGDECVLDPSCGSGVFLVESLRRLVALRIARGESATRELIRDVLYKQIFGIDVNPTAVRIAAFSLYLTALELDPSPQPPEELRFDPLIGHNLFAADAFDLNASFNRAGPFAAKSFALIVGNPPWTRGRPTRTAVEYCKERNLPLARDSIDQAFLWRIRDFINELTRIGLVLSAKPFFSAARGAQQARNALLTQFTPELLIDLSELRTKRLFPNATAPAMVMVAKAQEPTDDDITTIIHVEDSGSFRRLGIIEISPNRVASVGTCDLLREPGMLKVAAWGTSRDYALVKRLQRRFPPLRRWLKREGLSGGQGYQEAGSASPTPVGLRNLPVLPPEGVTRYQVLDKALVREVPETMHRSRKRDLYRGPLLITTRGIKTSGFLAAYSADDILYNEMFFGIVLSGGQHPHALHYLNAILNSSLAPYYLFLTGSSWGVERDEIKPNELKQFPIPPLPTGETDLLDRILKIEARIRQVVAAGNSTQELSALRKRLDTAVFALYNLRDAEIALIRDFCSVTFDRWRHGAKSQALAKVKANQLEAYGMRVAKGLTRVLRTIGNYHITAEVITAGSSPLAALRFTLVSAEPAPNEAGAQNVDKPEVRTVTLSRKAEELLEHLLQEIESHGTVEVAYGIVSHRATRLYRGSEIIVIKSVAHREWTTSAALVDTDSIIAESILGTASDSRDFREKAPNERRQSAQQKLQDPAAPSPA